METNYIIYIVAAIILIEAVLIILWLLKKRSSKNKEAEKSEKEISRPELENLRIKLAKTKSSFIGNIAEVIKLRGKVDEELMDELEEILIQADIGVDTSLFIIDKLREEIHLNKLTNQDEVQTHLENIIKEMLIEEYAKDSDHLKFNNKKPFVILFAGVNGVGKTTTIGKLARRFKDMGKSVLLIAGDTFRAAAIEQLTIWAERANVEIVKQQQGSDASSVVYDGVMKAVNQKFDVVLIDTAGRQHTKVNLMNELSKIVRTIKKIVPDAPNETLLVIDATTGQNAISQTELFNKAVNLSGLILTKLDGTAKGGIVIGIKHQLNIPVKLIGVGEKQEDLRDFDVNEFVEAVFE